MRIPSEIKGRNRIRDAKILSLYLSGEASEAVLAKRFGISQTRVSQVLKANARIVLDQRDWNKVQRIHLLKAELHRPEFQQQTLAKKDMIDLWRKEFEGEESINLIAQFLNVEIPTANRLSESQNRIDK